MSKCKYYTQDARNETGGVKIYGRCFGMKYAPNVSCGGDETKCEICKRSYEMQNDLHYDLVSEIVFQIKITTKDKDVEKVYCKSREDANSFISVVLSKRDLTRIQNIQITPIKNLYYRSK